MFGTHAAVAACTSDEIDVLGNGNQCKTNKFSVTTTSDATNLKFSIAAKGTFYVDCGDGGSLTQNTSSYGSISGKTISRTSVSSTTYTCTWGSAGAHTLRFGSESVTTYNTSTTISTIAFYLSSNGTQAKVASASGSLGALFPQLGTSNNQFPKFYSTFRAATNLTSIPETLFTGLTGGAYMFYNTFYGCTGLTRIPWGLFSDITTAANYMFNYTFYGCTNLSGYIPPTTFAGLIAKGSPSASYLWNYAFNNTALVTTCPSGMVQYTTGYEGTSAYTTFNSKVSCHCPTGQYDDGTTTCVACSNKPAGNSSIYYGISPNAQCPWTCSEGYGNDNGSCVACESNEFGTDNGCRTNKFSVTTTSDTTSLNFSLAAQGTFYVNCGDNGTLTSTASDVSGNTITRSNVNSATYTCTWSTAGAHTVKFDSDSVTTYNSGSSTPAISFYQSSNGTQAKIASVSGSLAALFPQSGTSYYNFPRFYQTFSGATNLTSIPSTLFTGLTGGAYMFAYTFQNCTKLASIPETLFNGITTAGTYMFQSTFSGCTTLTSIPAGLFTSVISNITSSSTYLFAYTFSGCSGLTSIPSTLFSSITTAANYMFQSTFSGCTTLTSIPSGLFSGITTAANYMFSNTFYNCSNLSGYIPPTTFAGLINNGSPTASGIWYYTFGSTGLATTCPTGTEQYITGYEGTDDSTSWNTRVSCGCPSGQYGDGTTCNTCQNTKPANSSFDVTTNSTCPWFCNEGYAEDNGTCQQLVCGENEAVFGNVCKENKFRVTTTSNTTQLNFNLSASGTFYVDCGDGGSLVGTGVSGKIITRSNTTKATYACTWQTPGAHTIKFSSDTVTGYNTSTTTAAISFYQSSNFTPTNIASISGSLGALLPQLGAFSGQFPRFYQTFYGATNMTNIPGTLFSGLTGGDRMFTQTFYICTGLTDIPAGLFSNIATGADYMFNSTFYGCTGLTSIPAGLFSGITNAAQGLFSNTFNGCSNLSGYIPPTTFAGLIANNSPSATYMWDSIFNQTDIATSCPLSMDQYITGYEGYWSGKVSCGCPSGQYGDGVTCTACSNTKPANSSFAVTTSSTCPWTCDDGYGNDNGTCVACTGNEFVANGVCQTKKFSVTTTSDTTSLFFTLSSNGTFYVNCGDGGSLTSNGNASDISGMTITRNNTSSATYTCTWPSAGAHTINFGSNSVTAYNTSTNTSTISFYQNSSTNQTKVASVSGSLGALFPQVGSSSGQFPIFYNTFYNATNLTSIPSTLFSGLTGGNYMFYSTFNGCTGLTGIPAELFSDITTATTYMFGYTFSGCTNLSGYIPPSAFSGLVANNSPSANNMWYNTFNNTGLATTCPVGEAQYITGYEGTDSSTSWNGKVSCFSACPVGQYGSAPTCAACQNTKPANSSFLASISSTCPWACDDGYGQDNGSCVACAAGDFKLNDICHTNKFSVTTTSDTVSLSWTMSATGTFYVNCGDDGTLTSSTTDISGSTITRNNVDSATYTCTWPSAGAHTVKFDSTSVSGYNGNTNIAPISFYAASSQTKVASLSGSLGALFPQLGTSNGQFPRFYQTFYGATNLTSISDTLFSGLTGGSYMFQSTFNGCTGLTSIPGGLFGDITTAGNYMFYNTFYNCSNLSGYIQPSTFSGLFANGSPFANNMWYNPFSGTALATTCPSDKTQYPTGYASTYWNGKVACYSECPAGQYGDSPTCTACSNTKPANSSYVASAIKHCPWSCDEGYGQSNNSCVACQSNEFGTETGCHTNKFSVTTTSDATQLKFILSANGTFYVNCGDGGTLTSTTTDVSGTTITRNYTTSQTYTCTWKTAGAHTVRFGSDSVTAYNTGATTPAISFYQSSNFTPTNIASTSGSLGALFPQIGTTNGQYPRFYQTFYGATNMTSIPSTLFSGLTGGGTYMFHYTFQNCTGLTRVPAGLFSDITTAADYIFSGAFSGCTNISSYIPPSTFAGLIANNSPSASYMWSSTFNNTALVTACPSGTSQYITGYEGTTSTTSWNGKVSCYAPCPSGQYGDYPTCATCTNTKPENSIYTVSPTSTCPWACSDGYGYTNGSCVACQSNEFGTDTGCQTNKFNVTTTSDTTSLKFSLTAQGTFYVNCGDGGTLTSTANDVSGNTITRSNTTSTTYTCTWPTAGAHTVKFGSDSVTAYNTGTSTPAISFYQSGNFTPTNIASISGSLGTLLPQLGSSSGQFPRFYQTFYGATNLTSISDTLFSGLTGGSYMFQSTFNGCTGLTTIPGTLFSGITTGADYMFQSTFNGCTGLTTIPGTLFSGITTGGTSMFKNTFKGCTGLTTIPGTLFSGITTGAYEMFYSTFNGCTGLTTIPGTLFSGITTGAGYMFYSTFQGCTGLTSIPSGLFSGISTVAQYMFYQTFNNCTNLTGFIPPTTFAGLIANGSPTADSMWYNTFNNTQLATSCPSSNPQYITGYEGTNYYTTWSGKVSCGCPVGQYGDGVTCAACTNKPANSDYYGISTTSTCPWLCSNGYGNDNGACTACESGEMTANGECQTEKFSVTTTSNTTIFKFNLSVQGTFYVNCGDGGTLTSLTNDVSINTITRNNTGQQTYTCTWPTAGAHRVSFGSDSVSAYSTIANTAAISFYHPSELNFTPTNIASISGSLGTLLPQLGTAFGQYPIFYWTFYNATNLTSIPSTLFSGLTGGEYMFYNTFSGCTGLTTIPGTLFSGITTGASAMFMYTFDGCTGLSSIPATLFSGITTGASSMFGGTFRGCTGITSIPGTLFSNITTGGSYMFSNTFYDCTNLTGYIPPTTFAGLIANGSPTATSMWSDAFTNTQVATSCPLSMEQYITGYEGLGNDYWNGKVSCGCPSGQYGDGVTCTACSNTKPANSSFAVTTSSTCPWTCDDGYANNNGTCQPLSCSENETLFGNVCSANKFSVTTTSDATQLMFALSAAGTFYVDCGDDGTLTGAGVSGKTIVRNDTNTTYYACTWNNAGAHTVRFGSDSVTAYNTGTTTPAISFYQSSNGTQTNVASVSGSLGALLPQLGTTSGQYPSFYQTFYNATNLTSIPSTLFSGLTGGEYMFYNTFYGCTGLTSIPGTMFSGITTGASGMFTQTFYGCTGLTSIPAGLFRNITNAASSLFSSTFSGCTSLTGYIPPTAFAGLIANSSPTASSMWYNTFNNTQLATSCPSSNPQYITGYEGTSNSTSWYGKVACGCQSGQYGDGETCNACTNTKPANSSFLTSTVSTCPWECDDGYINDNGTCDACSANEFVADNTCRTHKFSVTTTSNATQLSFSLSAQGTFYVNCGDGGTLTSTASDVSGMTITRNNTTSATYTCTWPSTGAHTVRFGSDSVSAYNTSTSTAAISFYANSTQANVASLSGSLGALLPQLGTSSGQYPIFYNTFYNTTNLTSIPATLFTGLTGGNYMFSNTFYSSGLTSIPATLFSGITTGANYMFASTFYNCNGLTSIPAGLFSSITTGAGYMFSSTFYNCRYITSIPAGLFSGITTAADSMFYQTFRNCTNLAGFIPPSTFAGLIANGSPTTSYMWSNTFYSTQVATTCPSTNPQYITGYEGSANYSQKWGSYVSCGCPIGQYDDGTSCTACSNKPANSSYTGLAITSSCPWTCDDGYGQENGACVACAANEFGTESGCHTHKFGVTTTSDATQLKFSLSAQGTFYVDCGDGGTLTSTASDVSGTTITRNNTTSATYTCTWASAGAHTVKFGSDSVSAYSTVSSTPSISFYQSSNGTQTNVASVSGSLGALLPQLGTTSGQYPWFHQTFYNATNLTNIPDTLFSGLTGGNTMFFETFNGCTGLTSIPAGLFSDISTAASSMFYFTFYNCTNLSGYIPPTTFSGLITNGSPTADSMFSNTFGNTGLVTTCPANTMQYITGYESDWSNKVSCQQNCPLGQYGSDAVCSVCTNTKPANSTWSPSTTAVCPFTCDAEYYLDYNVCAAVETGYYSDAGDNERHACTNKVTNSSYTGSAATNACPYACDAGYYLSGGQCVDAGVGYYSPAADNERYSCTNNTKPENSSWSANSSSATCVWTCDNGYGESNGACVAGICSPGQINILGNGTHCKTEKFSVTTTNDATQLKFSISAQGAFYVDCGDNGTLTSTANDVSGMMITRNDTTSATYTCTWNTAGAHTVRFSSEAVTGYNYLTGLDSVSAISFYQSSNGTQDKIASVSGSLGALMPQLGSSSGQYPKFFQTFYNATNLTSIPSTLFSGLTGGDMMFYSTFYGCTGLTSIPGTLFSSITTGAYEMFNTTFHSCTGLTTIPGTLFSGITTGADYMFGGTFYNCNGLTSIPSGLFSGISTAASGMFNGTFSGCTNLTGFIPPTTFARLISHGSPTTNYMWSDTFYNTQVATSCPSGTEQYITGYEGNDTPGRKWQSRVSCGCPAGQYGDGITCTTCQNTKPTNSSYVVTTDSTCPYTCNTGYYTNNGSCTACSNKPANSSYTGNAATNNCPWICDDGYPNNNGTCVACSANEFAVDNTCQTYKFGVTTTSGATELKFTMTATGTFYVDCGVGGTLTSSTSDVSGNTITRTNTTEQTYRCRWNNAGTHTVKFGGTATGYNTGSSTAAISFYNDTYGMGTHQYVASLFGSLGALFPQLGSAYGQFPIFTQTFKWTRLTSIPATLFSGLTGGNYMFANTFYGCSQLTSIPAGLFSSITGAATYMFSHTFYNCTNLSGYIPPTTFAGLIANGSPHADEMWYNTFDNTQVATSCPTGTRQYITGYEKSTSPWIPTSSNWDGQVSCEIGCPIGQYGDGTTCTACTNTKPANSTWLASTAAVCPFTCDAGYYLDNGQCVDPGAGYYSPAADNERYSCTNTKTANSSYSGSASSNACPYACDAGYYLSDNQCVDPGAGYYSPATDNERYSCTNTKPANSSYSGSASSNACPYACDAGYYLSDGQCVDAGTGYYSPAADNERYSCTNTIPTNSSYSGSASSNACPYACDAGYYLSGGQCVDPGVGYYSPATDNERYSCTNTIPTNSSYSGSASSNACPYACDTGYYTDNDSCTACTNTKPANSSYSGTATTNNCPWTCDSGYTENNGLCEEVLCSIGEYGNGITCNTCTNKVPHSSYTGAARTNTCAYACDAGYYLDNGACVNAGAGYYSPAADNERYSCTNTKPTNSSWSANSASATCSWTCDSGYIEDNGACAEMTASSCTGATYESNGQCVDCPSGYTYNTTNGKKLISQCQISCPAGKWPATNEYTQLDYLQTDGNAYIQTDYVGNLNSRYEGAVLVSITDDSYLIGSRMDTSNTRHLAFAGSSAGLYVGHGTYTPSGSYRFTHAANTKISFVTDYYNRSKSVTMNGATSTKSIVNSSEVTTTFTNTAPLQIFFDRLANGTVVSYGAYSGARVYYLKIYDTGVLVHNYVPARRNSDNVLGMYDTVTGNFLTNAGSGTFTAGSNIGSIATCANVDTGYWSAGGAINYGATPNECTNGDVHGTYTGSASSNACPYACNAGYYMNNNVCVDPGAGYYSPATDNNRYSCTNTKPANSSYSGSSTTNACPWSCDTGYSESNGTCVAESCPIGEYGNGTNCTACTNKPANSSYSGSSTTNACPWACDTGYSESNGTCVVAACSIGEYGNGTTCTACTNKPSNSTYTGSASTNACPWACDTGYVEYSNGCHAMCPAFSTFHVGSLSYPVFADITNVPTPVLGMKYNNDVCYVYMEPDTNNESGLKIRYNNTTYHAIDPRPQQ